MRLHRWAMLSSLGALLVATPALAQPGGMGRGMGHGMGHGMGMGKGGMGGLGLGGMGMGRCGMMLIHAPPDALKSKLGLNHGQIAKLQPIRTNFISKRIGLQAQAQQIGLQLKTYLEGADVPEQKKVLDLARKVNNVHWQILEERVKAQIQIMQVLTKDQRGKLRSECASFGQGHGMGMGRGRRGGGPGGQGGQGF